MKIEDVSKNMNKKVRFNDGREDITLTLTACILRIRDGQFYYQAELMDRNKNSVLIVSLDKVEELSL